MHKTVKKERFYPHPVDRVWAAVTDPAALEKWFMQADFRAEVGYQFSFQDQPRGKWDGRLKGEVLKVDKPSLLAYTWKGDQMNHETTVTWHLSAYEGGTLLRLEHTGFQGLNDVVIGWFHQLGWNKYFAQLTDYLLQIDSALQNQLEETAEANHG